MSSPARAPVHQPRGRQGRPAPRAGQEQRGTLGLVSATGLVMSTIVGVGVFTIPAVLAEAGTSSLVVLAVVSVGAILLAVLFGQLTARVPNSDGGLYAYARHEFGDFAGYLTGWSYWISSWPGNAAIAVSWVFYVNALFGARGKQAFALIEEVGERVAAVMVVSYPPGIPLLMPGEQAGASDGPILGNLKALQDLDRKFPGFEHDIHGVRGGAGGVYEVMCVQRHAAGQDGVPAHA